MLALEKVLFLHICGDWEKTFKAFDRILVFDPENTQASVMKAFALIRLQKFEKAASILEKLIRKRTSVLIYQPACWVLPVPDWKISREPSGLTRKQLRQNRKTFMPEMGLQSFISGSETAEVH